MLARSLQGLCASDWSCSRARACRRVQVDAASGGRRENRRALGDRQVLHYRSSSPVCGPVDTEQPAAAVVQPLRSLDQQQLDHGVLPRDLDFELHQSQERLHMAKVLRLERGGMTQTAVNPDQHMRDDLVDVEGSKQQQPQSLDAAAAAAVEDAIASAAMPLVDFLLPSQPSLLGQSQTELPAKDVINTAESSSYSNYNIIGWGNVADALGLNNSNAVTANTAAASAPTSTSTAAAAAAPAAGIDSDDTSSAAQATSAVNNNSDDTSAAAQATSVVNIDSDDTSAAAQATSSVVVVRKPKREVPQDQLKVVHMMWAQDISGAPPRTFYMPDPLSVPCLVVEADVEPPVVLEAYDAELAEIMWEEAYRVERAVEEEASAAAANSSSDSITTEADSASETSSGSNDSVASTATSATVEFKFHCQTQMGERLWLIGDQPTLGSWDLQQAVKLTWSDGHIWKASLELPLGTKAAYKAVLQLSNKEYKWQSGADHMLEVNGSCKPPQHAFR